MLKTMTIAVALALGSVATASAYSIQEQYLFDRQSAPEHVGWNGFTQLGNRGVDAFASAGVPRNAASFATPRVRAANPNSLFELRRDEQWKTGG